MVSIQCVKNAICRPDLSLHIDNHAVFLHTCRFDPRADMQMTDRLACNFSQIIKLLRPSEHSCLVKFRAGIGLFAGWRDASLR